MARSFRDKLFLLKDALWRCVMRDTKGQAEKLRKNAAECALIRDLATDPTKRELFTCLADHLNLLAQEIERAIASAADKPAA